MICLQMEKTNTTKTSLGEFKVTTPEISLLPQLPVTSKRISVSYTNLQLNPYPSTQLDLFYSDNFSFWCMAPSTWLTNCADLSMRLQSPTREGCWLQSSSVHHIMKIQKILGYKTLQPLIFPISHPPLTSYKQLHTWVSCHNRHTWVSCHNRFA